MTQTPILDLAETELFYEGERPGFVVQAVSAILGILFGLIPLLAFDPAHNFFLGFPILVCALLGAVTVHELGHVFAARVVGFRVTELRIGMFGFIQDPDGFAFDFKMVPGFLGWVKADPNGRILHRAALIFRYASGPASNLAFGLLSVAFRHKGPFWGQFAWINLIVFASSLLPTYSKGVPSDGRALLILSRARSAAQFIAIHRLWGPNWAHPRQWRTEDIDHLTAFEGASRECMIGYFLAATHAMACHRWHRAPALLEQALRRSNLAEPPIRQAMYRLASGIHRFKRNERGSQEWLRRANFEQRDPATRGLLGLG